MESNIIYCCICNDKLQDIIDQNKNLYTLTNKNINLTNIHPICDECFYSDTYIDLMKILDQYELNEVNMVNFRVFLYKEKFYILSYEWKDFLKSNSRAMSENTRKSKLIKIINEYKLNDVKLNICKAYIKFGQPSLEYVVKQLQEKQTKKNNRMYNLISKLKKHGKQYDEKIPAYSNYIKNGGNINNIIKESELESIFVYNTNYLHYLKHNDANTARYLASIEYVNSGKSNELVNNFISKKNTIKFA
jgi:hypothetical protein